jgi:hypothetical protein
LAKEGVDLLNQLKETHFLIWDHGRDKEVTRMQALKELYDNIIANNNSIFGQNPTQLQIIEKLNAIDNSIIAKELFSFHALISD